MTKKKGKEQDLATLFDGLIDTTFKVASGTLKTGMRAALTLKNASDAVEDGRAEEELKRGKEQFEAGLRKVGARAKSMLKGFLDDVFPDEKKPEVKK